MDETSPFTFSTPNSNKASLHDMIRSKHQELAEVIEDLLPDCPEREQSLNKLRESMFWANSGLALRTE